MTNLLQKAISHEFLQEILDPQTNFHFVIQVRRTSSCCIAYIFGKSSSIILMHRAKELSKILVAMDGSEASIRAAKYAYDIATRSNIRCALYLIHIIPPHVLLARSSGYFGAIPPSYQKEIEEEAEEWFKRLPLVPKNGRVHVIKKVISTGASIVTELASYADEKEIELIVIGATGKSGLKRLLLGSVSAGVVAHSYCSVLIVR